MGQAEDVVVVDDFDGGAGGQVLDGVEELAAEMLGAGRSHVEVAEQLAVSTKWVQRRVARPEFARRVAAVKTARVSQAIGQLSELMIDAVSTLGAELKGEKPADRLRAAGMVISAVVRLREHAELERSIADLCTEIAELRAVIEETGR